MAQHGTLVDVAGVGVLLLGPSGIGKSECALELVRRGHRLIADDVVEVELDTEGAPIGRAAAHIGHHIEIRGLGILCVPDLFGDGSVQDSGRIDLACRLRREREEGKEFDRVGIDRPLLELLPGARVPLLTLPAHPAGTLATLVEVGARDQALRATGRNGAARFDAALRAHMGEG
jgi:HPr kinase/phosphorylase